MKTANTVHAGFTLVELIMVIVLLSILSATAIPRFFDRSGFETRAFFDDTLNAVRYARKLAVTSGCNVRVNFTDNGYSLLHADTCSATTFASNLTVKQPNSSSAYSATNNNLTLARSRNSTTFDALGQADHANSISIGSRTITIVQTTGFVYDSTP